MSSSAEGALPPETPGEAASDTLRPEHPGEQQQEAAVASAEPGKGEADEAPTKHAHFDSDKLSQPAPTPRRPAVGRSKTTPAKDSVSWSIPSDDSPPVGDNSRPVAKRPTPADLNQTISDLKRLLLTFRQILPRSLSKLRVLVPSPVFNVARFIIRQIAMVLHKRGALASNMFYDFMVLLWKTTINIFFREIRSRGAWKVPKNGEGAVIFVVGPHHNQFLDPLLLMSEVRRETGRRISFLIAEKSMRRKFIGQAASLMQSISVARAQDMASPGKGTITASEDDATIIIGEGTKWTETLKPRMQLQLPKDLGSVTAEILEVLDDGKVKLKKDLNKKALDELRKRDKGVSYKVLPYIDQSQMYGSVYKKLKEGGNLGIFPEGGSHDRTDLLPLKAGVSIMALGALSANPDLKLHLIPVGLSYFHPHKFRSRAVVEFGSPIAIPREMVEQFEKGGDEKKGAVASVMDLVVDGLKSVTVRAPDWETLMLIQATRRLYRPPGQQLSLGQVVELNKRFIAGYEVYKDEPKLKELRKKVEVYNKSLRYLGLKDHQVDHARSTWRSLVLLAYRAGLLTIWGGLALPGVILNSPIFIAAKIISHRKAKEALAASTVKIKGNDVLATWKVLVALAGAPVLYTIYAIGATVLAFKLNLPTKYKFYAPFATIAGLPFIGYSALRFGEVGMDIYKSLRPLFLSLIPGYEKEFNRMRSMRTSLQHDISDIVEEFGPQLFEDFQQTRVVPAAAPPPASPTLTRRRSTYGPRGQGTLLTHPMSWVDEYLFGWSTNATKPSASLDSDAEAGSEGAPASGYMSGYTTEGDQDYDEVISILSREMGGGDEPSIPGEFEGGLKYRRGSRSRSRSHLNLTALNSGAGETKSAPGSRVTSPTRTRTTGFTMGEATKRVGTQNDDEDK